MLKFIGTGSAFNTELGNTSAYIKENDNLLLLDCGETVFSRIKDLNILEDVKNVYIAITHNHSDHVASLPTLIEYLNLYKGIIPNIILANDDSSEKQEQNLKALLEKFAISEEDYEFTYGDMIEGVITDLNKIEFVEVKHSSKLTSYAIELQFSEFTIYYVGDNKDVAYLKKIAKKLKKDDLVFTDCMLKDYKGSIHVTLDELNSIFDKEQKKQVTCMHFDGQNTYCLAKEMGFEVANKELDKKQLLRRMADKT